MGQGHRWRDSSSSGAFNVLLCDCSETAKELSGLRVCRGSRESGEAGGRGGQGAGLESMERMLFPGIQYKLKSVLLNNNNNCIPENIMCTDIYGS